MLISILTYMAIFGGTIYFIEKVIALSKRIITAYKNVMWHHNLNCNLKSLEKK